MKKLLKNNRGYVAVGAALTMMVIGLFGMGTATLVHNSQDEKANTTNKDRSHFYAQAAMEYTQKRVDQALSPVVTDFPFGNGSFSVTTSPPTVTVVGKSDIAVTTYQFEPDWAASCVSLSCELGMVSGTDITGVKFKKTCPTTPIVSEMKINLTVGSGEEIETIRMDGSDVYNDPSGTPMDIWMDIIDLQIPETTTEVPIDYFRFDTTLPAQPEYTISAKFSDESTTEVYCANINGCGLCGGGPFYTEQELLDFINQEPPMLSSDLKNILKDSAPLTSAVLYAAANRPIPMISSDFKDVLLCNGAVHSQVLIDTINRIAPMNTDDLKAVLICFSPLPEYLLLEICHRNPPMISSNLKDVLLASSPNLPASVVTEIQNDTCPLDSNDKQTVLNAQ